MAMQWGGSRSNEPMNQSQAIIEAMKGRPPALEPWKNRKHVRIRQKANDMVVSGELKPKACQHRGCSVGPSKTVKHHVDYDRPDNVKWYCEPHHDDTHAAMDKMPVESCSAKCSTCDRESCRCTASSSTNQSQRIMADLGEAKQVGVLYHFTSLGVCLNVVETDSLGHPEGGGSFISFTRNPRLLRIAKVSLRGFDQNPEVVFVVDGDKLSNKYPIGPIHFPGFRDEFEEVVRATKISPFRKNLLRVVLFRGELSGDLRDSMDGQEFLPKEFLDSEPITWDRVEKFISSKYGKRIIQMGDKANNYRGFRK